MKKRRFISVLIIMVILCFTIQAQRTELSQFNKLEMGSDIDVQLILDKACGIEWAIKNIDPEKIITEVNENTLRIRTKPGVYKDAEIKARIFYTDLSAIQARGRATIWSEEDLYLETIRFDINNGGECRLKVFADTLFASVTEGSIITLKGETNFLDVKVGSGATFSGYDLEAEEATVLANSKGKAKIAVNKYLKAVATSYGFIGYIGEPEKVDKEASLGGEIVQTEREE